MPLHVEDHPGRPPATVWLHHGVGSTRSWDAFLPAAAGGRRALAYDRHGFGASPRGRVFTPALFEEDAADLEALLASRCPGPAHLVGHSDGGTVALLVAARRPEAVLSLALVAAHVRGDQGTIGTLRRMGPPAGWPEPMRRSLRRDHGAGWEDVAGGWHRLWTAEAWEGWSVVEEIGAVRCPVLVVHDRRDPLAPPLHAEEVLRRLPRARALWLDSGGHDPHRRFPDEFTAALHSLWGQAERGGDG